MVQVKDFLRVLESLRLLGKVAGQHSELVWLVSGYDREKLEQTVAKISSGRVLKTSRGDVTGKIIGTLRAKKTMDLPQLMRTLANGKKKVPPLKRQKILWTIRALHTLRIINIEEKEAADGQVSWLGTGPMLVELKNAFMVPNGASGHQGVAESNGSGGLSGTTRQTNQNQRFHWEKEGSDLEKGSLNDLPMNDLKDFLERFESENVGSRFETLHQECGEPLILGNIILPSIRASHLTKNSI